MLWLFSVLLSAVLAQEIIYDTVKKREFVAPPSTLKDDRPWGPWTPDNEVMRHIKKVQGKTVFDYLITRSPWGFRLYPGLPARLPPLQQHLILAGCSFIFGEGVKDELTSGYLLARQFPWAHVVNMGRRGGYAADHLFIFKHHDVTSVVPEKKGLMVYTLFSDQFRRLALDWTYLSWAPKESPYYRRVDGAWVYDGTMEDRRSYQWAQWIKRSGLELWWLRLTSHFESGSNLRTHERVDELMVSQLNELKREYLRQYPEGRFVVSWFVHSPPKELSEYVAPFVGRLKSAGFEVWENPPDEARMRALGGRRAYAIELDGHPSPLGHSEYARFIAAKIKSTAFLPGP